MKLRVILWPDDLDYGNKLQYDYQVGPFELPVAPVGPVNDPADYLEALRVRNLRESAINCIKADIAYAMANALDKIDHAGYREKIGLPPVSPPIRRIDKE